MVDPFGRFKDTNPPTWDEPLDDWIYYCYGVSFKYDVNASDDIEIDQYWIGDNTNFTVDQEGIITNATFLKQNINKFNICVNDTSGNKINEEITLEIIGIPEEDEDDGTTDDGGGDGGGSDGGSGDDGIDDEDSGDEENGGDEGDSSDNNDGTDGGSNESIPGFPVVFILISMVAISALFSKRYFKRSW